MVALQKVRPEPKGLDVNRHVLALSGFFGIMQRWGVGNNTARFLLGSPAERTFFE